GVRALSIATGPPQTGWRVERHSHRRPRQAHRTLAERNETSRVRARKPRLGSKNEGQQVRRLSRLRTRGARTHRAAGRSRRFARLPQYPDQGTSLTFARFDTRTQWLNDRG